MIKFNSTDCTIYKHRKKKHRTIQEVESSSNRLSIKPLPLNICRMCERTLRPRFPPSSREVSTFPDEMAPCHFLAEIVLILLGSFAACVHIFRTSYIKFSLFSAYDLPCGLDRPSHSYPLLSSPLHRPVWHL